MNKTISSPFTTRPFIALPAVLAALLLSACQTAEPVASVPETMTTVDQIGEIADQYQVVVRLYGKNLKTGKEISVLAEEKVPVTSMIKPLVVAAVEQQLIMNPDLADTLFSINPKDRVGGSGVIRHLNGELLWSVTDLAALTIIESDNIATNKLISLAGPTPDNQWEAINGFFVSNGLTNTGILNYFLRLDTKKNTSESEKFGVAFSTAADLASFMEKVSAGKMVNAEVSEKILNLMKQSNDDTMAPRFMPVGEPGFELAHRSGGTTKYKGDFGWIKIDGQELVFAVITENLADSKATIENHGIISSGILIKLIADELTR